jgi:TATA-box binding protein (TBP) (component of TFIID and TFIIIB)
MTQEPIVNPEDLDINIVNVVASVTLNQKFNLLDIVKNFRNVEYNRERFPGLVFRLKRPKTTGPSTLKPPRISWKT